MKIQAEISHGLGESLKIEEVELSEPGADEMLIKIVATGVCHTDAESMNGRGAPFPTVLGHEGAGIKISISHCRFVWRHRPWNGF